MNNDLQKKLNNLKWLKSVGIEYYCSDKKDSKISLIHKLKENNKNNKRIEGPSHIFNKVDLGKANKPILMENDISIMKKKEVKKKTVVDANSDKNIISARNLANSVSDIDELKKALESFEGCKLKHFANNTVFSDGNINSPILLLGEAPGATEDEQGIPFCGESGVMLDKMLETIGVSRKKNAYITNSVFWRPPANRPPTRAEIEVCKPFVEKHIALIKPKLIILVGGTAVSALLGNKIKISDIRKDNQLYSNEYLEKPITATALFHPAFLLRQPSKKKDAWFDLLKIQEWIKTNIGDI